MPKRKFAIVIHDHQPVGNFENVMERAFRKAYKPFLDTLERHQGISITMHHSGVLLEWLERRHPKYIDRLGSMVEDGQIEMMTGGFFEPILPSIPHRDRIGQIRKLSKYLEKRFGVVPRGAWLAERVWEPNLPQSLHAAGVEYTLLDENHFRASGMARGQLDGYFLTEDEGDPLAVFPIDRRLRYMIPYEPAEKVIEYLISRSAARRTLFIMGDDGEKLGMWPGTSNRCYREGWLTKFFELMEKEPGIDSISLAAYLDENPAQGRVYIPDSSYQEMNVWSLPTEVRKQLEENRPEDHGEVEMDAALPRGGLWRGFLAKYDEANWMHKRMLTVSAMLSEIRNGDSSSPEFFERAADHLYRAQCNCAYWHGVFGGLYLPHLREANYANIIAAEEAIGAAVAGRKPSHRVEDLDRDGDEEVVLKNEVLALYLAPHRGGCILEIDHLPSRTNLTETLLRRPEPYHDNVAAAGTSRRKQAGSIHGSARSKEKGLEELLHYDEREHHTLLDHFFAEEADFNELRQGRRSTFFSFSKNGFDWEVKRRGNDIVMIMTGRAHLRVSGKRKPVWIKKTVVLSEGSSGFRVDCELENRGRDPMSFTYGIEWNLNLRAGRSNDRYFRIPGRRQKNRFAAASSIDQRVEILEAVDEYMGLCIRLSMASAAEIWRFPLETVSLSEDGFERIYQGSVVVTRWPVTLSPGGIWCTSLGFDADFMAKRKRPAAAKSRK